MSSNATGAEPARAPVALVAAHGDLAAGLRSAVEQITGRGVLLDVLSNRELGAPEIEEAIRDRLASADAYVVFTDLPAGSCAIAARRVQRDRPELTVVTGTNLSTLLDFVCAADGACGAGGPFTPEAARAAAARAVQRGQVAIVPAAAGAPNTAGVPGGPRAG